MKKAFSLTELLVTSAIIAVLAGIALPVMSKSRKSARTIVCKSNLKSLYYSTEMMKNDCIKPRAYEGWQEGVASYVGIPYPSLEESGYPKRKPYWCPEDKRPEFRGWSYSTVMPIIWVNGDEAVRYVENEGLPYAGDIKGYHDNYRHVIYPSGLKMVH